MLTAHALSPEALKKSIEMKARAYLPKEKLGEVVPFLEDMLKYDYESGWKRLMDNCMISSPTSLSLTGRRRPVDPGRNGSANQVCNETHYFLKTSFFCHCERTLVSVAI